MSSNADDGFVEREHSGDIIRVARAHNRWLGVIDIVDKAPVTVTIATCGEGIASFEKGRKENVQFLRFQKTDKMLVLNATNAKTLAGTVGRTKEQLVGKVIELHVEKLDRPFNGSTHGIRIRIPRQQDTRQ